MLQLRALVLALAVAALPLLAMAADDIYYVDWTSGNPRIGTATGNILLPAADGSTSIVAVSFKAINEVTGQQAATYGQQINNCQFGQIAYWRPADPYVSAEYPNAPPACDILQLGGGDQNIRYTITLSEPIKDPVMVINSLGSGGDPARYIFDTPFTLIQPTSPAKGYWSGSASEFTVVDQYTLDGREGAGLIRFDGTYSTFSWTCPDGENWHGYTFAIRTSQALDCQVSDWANDPLATCTATCGPDGVQRQTRTITRQPTGAGVTCPALEQFVPCNRDVPCDVDCEVGNFVNVGTCSASCGPSGVQLQQRSIEVQPVGNGAACPALEQTVECNRDIVCPVDCVVSGFTNVGECSASCGPTGEQKQTQTVLVPQAGTGAACPALEQFVPCNREIICDVDCKVGDFVNVGECSATCGPTGVQLQQRPIEVAQAANGAACPALEQTVECNRDFVCPVDCVVSYWTDVGTCSKECGSAGLQQQILTVLVPQAGTGAACPAELERSIECNRFQCTCPTTVPAPASYLAGVQTGTLPSSTTSFTIACAAGFESSVTQSVCQEDGSWTAPAAPICSPKKCPEVITAPAGGSVSNGGIGYTGSSVTYSCGEGFVLAGAASVFTCQPDGTFTSATGTTRPTCVASTCAQLVAPANGYLTAASKKNEVAVTFNCFPGFTRVGQHQTYKCHLPNGQLTPQDKKPMPTCVPTPTRRRLLSLLEN